MNEEDIKLIDRFVKNARPADVYFDTAAINNASMYERINVSEDHRIVDVTPTPSVPMSI